MIHPRHGSRTRDGKSRNIKQHEDSTMTVYPDMQLDRHHRHHCHHCHDNEQLNDDDDLITGAVSCVVCGVWCVVCGVWCVE